MTREEINRFLVEAKNPDGSLFLSQYDGCWHKHAAGGTIYFCVKCKSNNVTKPNPDLHTWPGFGDLWETMQKREDWEAFKAHCNGEYWPEFGDGPIPLGFHEETINPLTFPGIVAEWRKKEDV